MADQKYNDDDKYHDDRYRNDKYHDDRYRDDRYHDDRYRDNKYHDDRYRDDKYRSDDKYRGDDKYRDDNMDTSPDEKLTDDEYKYLLENYKLIKKEISSVKDKCNVLIENIMQKGAIPSFIVNTGNFIRIMNNSLKINFCTDENCNKLHDTYDIDLEKHTVLYHKHADNYNREYIPKKKLHKCPDCLYGKFINVYNYPLHLQCNYINTETCEFLHLPKPERKGFTMQHYIIERT